MFPVELLALIVEHVSDHEDLHVLAKASRDFNFLAVEKIRSKYNFYPRDDVLILDNHTMSILPTLAISLSMFGARLHYLKCDLTNTRSGQEMLEQTTSLLNFISILSSVYGASFYFFNTGAKEWEDTMTMVLNSLADKSCSNVHIKSLTRSATLTSRNSKLTALLQKFSLPSVVKKRKNSKAAWPDNTSNEIETCYLQTLPTFVQPLFLYRLNTSSRLTTLTFRYIYNYQEWDEFILHLNLPHLTTLTVSHCIITGDAFTTFLIRHPTITSLDFHHNTFLRNNPLTLPAGILPRLNSLRMSSVYLARYFPSLATFPQLTTVILPAGDMTRDSTGAAVALQALVPCANDITLCLEFTYVQSLGNWLRDSLMRAEDAGSIILGNSEPTRQLHCVKALKLDSRLIAYSTDSVVDLLARWLCLFPALDWVYITRPCLPRVFTREQFWEFEKIIARGSPSIRNINVEATDFSTWTWCANQSKILNT